MQGGPALPAGTDCNVVAQQYKSAVLRITPSLDTPESRDAISRVAYAEAGNQGDSGLAGVVYTIINRLVDGGFGSDLETVLNAPGQFEPVTKAHGWQRLPVRSAVEQAHIETILNLALDGRLPDPTNGARYFQNPAVVASREAVGAVSAGLTNFGGQKPISVIRDHAFYDTGRPGRTFRRPAAPSLFVPVQTRPSGQAAVGTPSQPELNPLFVPVQSAQ
jgi:spore germination cell wall hydrolase CwlJ-like protein